MEKLRKLPPLNKNFLNLIHAIDELIICVSKDLKIIALNLTAEKVFQCKNGKTIGMLLKTFFTQGKWSGFSAHDCNLLKKDHIPLQSIELKKVNQKIIWTIQYFLNEQGQHEGYILIGHYLAPIKLQPKTGSEKKLHIDQVLEGFHQALTAKSPTKSAIEYGAAIIRL